jgi:NitT/TauT family transport system permease protein
VAPVSGAVVGARSSPAGASGGPSGSTAPGRAPRLLGLIRSQIPAVIIFVGALVVWEAVATWMAGKVVVLPPPSSIADALVANWDSARYPLGAAARATLFEAMGGLLIGTTAGVVVALLAARFVTARDILLPVAVAAGAIPIIAMAPLLSAWFGLLNPLSKMMMAALLVFFPVMASVTLGLVSVDKAALELTRSYASSDWAVLRKVRIPNALPYFFTALKLATTLCLIGAIVAEYFGGQRNVIGRIIVESASSLAFDVTWAAIILGAIAGIVLYLAVSLLERLVIPWYTAARAES